MKAKPGHSNFFRYQEKLRVHSLRVMFVVEKTLNRIDNEENAAKVMKRSSLLAANDQWPEL